MEPALRSFSSKFIYLICLANLGTWNHDFPNQTVSGLNLHLDLPPEERCRRLTKVEKCCSSSDLAGGNAANFEVADLPKCLRGEIQAKSNTMLKATAQVRICICFVLQQTACKSFQTPSMKLSQKPSEPPPLDLDNCHKSPLWFSKVSVTSIVFLHFWPSKDFLDHHLPEYPPSWGSGPRQLEGGSLEEEQELFFLASLSAASLLLTPPRKKKRLATAFATNKLRMGVAIKTKRRIKFPHCPPPLRHPTTSHFSEAKGGGAAAPHLFHTCGLYGYLCSANASKHYHTPIDYIERSEQSKWFCVASTMCSSSKKKCCCAPSTIFEGMQMKSNEWQTMDHVSNDHVSMWARNPNAIMQPIIHPTNTSSPATAAPEPPHSTQT